MNAARALYSLLTWCAQPLLRHKLRRRAVAEPGYAHAVGERFGRYPPPIDSLIPHSSTDPLGRFVWVHAVSLGETRAAAILLAQLREQLPGMRLLLTHGTATGRAEGEKLLLPGDVQVWQPWDTPGAVSRFLRKFRPAIGILMETEVWPNLVAGCRQRRIPLVLANARFNETSLRKAQRLSALARPAYGGLTAVWAQTQEDATRLAAIGAPVRGVLGNLKFDVVPDAQLLERGREWRARTGRPVVLLASSREGEEALWLEQIQKIRKKMPQAPVDKASDAMNNEASGTDLPDLPTVQWLIVPRHPQRFEEVSQLLQRAGLSVSRRSAWAAAPVAADVWLGDSIGEMALYYGLADVALLGGSFAPLGGQNLIEATACGCPVVLGPHTFNFAEAAELACAAGAAQRVPDLSQGMAQAAALAGDARAHQEASERATRFAATHRGAAQATARAIVAMVHPEGGLH
ncbi:MAG TPA: 3-deoxy-D-manno-octulosonic acid transferase [Acidovorax sp.]|nr:3-deoxy-D-manno-octulosonic acid transferase [Acidovorax sp.]